MEAISKFMNPIIIEAKNIFKNYSGKPILKDVSLVCERGKAIALVGPNGCGKSTLLRILAGVTNASAGKVIKHYDPIRAAFIPDHYEKVNISIRIFMKYVMEIYGLKNEQEKLNDLYNTFQLNSLLDTPMKHLSKGSLQKVAAIQALVCESDVLFMDEPLSGQDVLSKLSFIRTVIEMKKEGTAIIMACHEKDLIEEVADSIFLIKDGGIFQTSDNLSGSGSKSSIFILGSIDEKHLPLEQLMEIKECTEIGNKYKIVVDVKNSQEVFRICLERNIHIIRYEEVEVSNEIKTFQHKP